MAEKLQEKQTKLNASVDGWQRAKNLSSALEKVSESLDLKDFVDALSLDHVQLQEERLLVEVKYVFDFRKIISRSLFLWYIRRYNRPFSKNVADFWRFS